MKMNWTRLYEKHKGMWVALDTDNQTIVGKGPTAAWALGEARGKGFADAALTYIPQEVVAFAGQRAEEIER